MNKKLITSILVSLCLAAVSAINFGGSACGGSCFAATQVAATATATVLPEGVFAPVINAGDQSVRENDPPLEFEVSATDANTEDTVRIEMATGQPSWLSIVSNTDGNPAKMVLRAVPPVGAAGQYKISFTATDNSSYNLSTTKDIYITVEVLNRPPVITAENQNVLVGRTLTFTVTFYEPDGDSFSAEGGPVYDWLTSSFSGNNPRFFTLTGTPEARHIGTAPMTFTATDNGTPPQTTTKEITITVSRENHPPVLEPIRDKESPIRVKLEFTLRASDPDGDKLTYDVTGLPSGASFNPATGTFSWTPTNAQVGQYPVHFEVSDGELTDSEDIIIYVVANDPPVFDTFPEYKEGFYKLRVGGTLHFAVTARDPNNEKVNYDAQGLPTGAAFDPGTHTFHWIPAAGQEGTYEVTFTASDGINTTTAVATMIILPVTAPMITPVDDMYISAGRTLSCKLSATDPDTPLNKLVYSVSNNPAGSNVTGDTFTWTPTPAQVGTYKDVVFSVSDGSYTDTTVCWIFVLPGGAPIIEPISAIHEIHGIEGRNITFTVNATDPDGDALTYLPPINAPKGSYFDAATHTFTWTPAIGEAGVYKDIIFRVTDGTYTSEEIIWIFISENGAPIIEPVFDQYVKPGQLLSFSVNAYDPNGDELTYKALNIPADAVFTGRTFTWTPTLAEAGKKYKDVIFEVSDGVNISTARIWIFVYQPGAPVIERVGDKYVTAGQTLTFTVNASDPDNDPLTYSASNLPRDADFNTTTHVFTWTPAIDQVGEYSDVLFHVTDGAYTTTETIWIFVKGPNAPTLNLSGDQRVRAGSLLEFSIDASDPNTPPSELQYSASNLPLGATFNNQVFRWIPTEEQIGTYPNVRFTVSDGTYTDSKVIWIVVTSLDAPEFTQNITTKDGRINEPLTFTIPPANDPDNTDAELNYYGINLPQGATFTDRTFRWTPTASQAGTYENVRLEVKDPDNNIDADIFWINISGNTPPELDYIGTKYGTAGQPMTFIVSAVDYDNDPLTYSASNLPSGASFNADTRTFSWTPPSAGTYTGIHFEVSDGRSTDSEDISIVISS